jgi:hypothetical protein
VKLRAKQKEVLLLVEVGEVGIERQMESQKLKT